jgi:UDP-2-acetamido-2,6-beta-L-arabino-hexul-4-ose reductase
VKLIYVQELVELIINEIKEGKSKVEYFVGPTTVKRFQKF